MGLPQASRVALACNCFAVRCGARVCARVSCSLACTTPADTDATDATLGAYNRRLHLRTAELRHQTGAGHSITSGGAWTIRSARLHRPSAWLRRPWGGGSRRRSRQHLCGCRRGEAHPLPPSRFHRAGQVVDPQPDVVERRFVHLGRASWDRPAASSPSRRWHGPEPMAAMSSSTFSCSLR